MLPSRSIPRFSGSSVETLSEEWGWASLRQRRRSPSCSLVLNQQESDKAPAFTGSLYFHTDDADGLWQRLKDKARVCYPIENFEYGMREFGIYDNNGYLFQFGQPLPAAP